MPVRTGPSVPTPPRHDFCEGAIEIHVDERKREGKQVNTSNSCAAVAGCPDGALTVVDALRDMPIEQLERRLGVFRIWLSEEVLRTALEQCIAQATSARREQLQRICAAVIPASR